MNLAKLQSVHDFKRAARRRLPRIVFDYVEGGTEDESCLDRNAEALDRINLLPRYLIDVRSTSQKTGLLGRNYELPFGIAPMGMAGMVRHGADLMMAGAARAANIPFVLSGVATESIEAAAERAGDNLWVQIHASRDPAVNKAQIDRALAVGVETMILTIDVPVTAKRERDLRNGWVRPYTPSASAVIEAAFHPAWVLGYLRSGLPYFENWRAHAPAGSTALGVAAYLATQVPASPAWADLARFRSWWPGQLLLKGVLVPEDAARARESGVDGLIVSNHGGRQLDTAPAPITMLPAIRRAVGPDFPLIFDSGIRRGSDIVKALAAGADFTLVGRAIAYGVAAGGEAGASRVIDILCNELHRAQAQLGRPAIVDIDNAVLAGFNAPIA